MSAFTVLLLLGVWAALVVLVLALCAAAAGAPASGPSRRPSAHRAPRQRRGRPELGGRLESAGQL